MILTVFNRANQSDFKPSGVRGITSSKLRNFTSLAQSTKHPKSCKQKNIVDTTALQNEEIIIWTNQEKIFAVSVKIVLRGQV